MCPESIEAGADM
jgi:hypothetical protein